MVGRRTAMVDGRPVEVFLPDEEWLAEKYEECSHRFFTRWKVPDISSGNILIRIVDEPIRGSAWGNAHFHCSECGGVFYCTVNEAPTPRPSHVEADSKGFVWFKSRSRGEPVSTVNIATCVPLPETVWINVLVHEMVHVACHWNGLWTGSDGHGGWFLDIADEIRESSGGSVDITPKVPLEFKAEKDEVEAESMESGKDFGFAVWANILTPRGKFPMVWRCPSLESAKSGARAIWKSREALFDSVPSRVVGLCVIEYDRGNVDDRTKRYLVAKRYRDLPEFPGTFPAPVPSNDEFRAAALASSKNLRSFGGVISVWDIHGYTDEYKRKHPDRFAATGIVTESIVGDFMQKATKTVSRLAERLKSIVGSLWGKPVVRDYGDGYVDIDVP